MSNDILVDETSAAREFVDKHQDLIRFDHSCGQWFIFDGARWSKDTKRVAFEWARSTVESLSKNLTAKAKIANGRAAFARGVETFAQSDPRVAVTSDHWDRDHWLLGTPGGTVDLRDGKLREPDPADCISKIVAVAPAPSADCPTFLSFLYEACGGDADVVGFLRRWFGYCLTGDAREQSFVFLVGDGGNGKGVLLNTIRSVFDSYATNAAMETFIAAYGDRKTNDLAALKGSRLVTASETAKGRAWDDVRVKTLTGGDPITARFHHREFFTFTPSFKLTFIGNHKPDLQSVNDAMRRRINIVEFNHKPAKPDLRLEEKLGAEWPGILRWAIDGCLEWQAGGLRRPAAVVAATQEYFSEQDVFGRWLGDECVTEPGNELMRTPSSELWESWRRYALQNHKAPGRMNEFAAALLERGAGKYWSRDGRGFTGIVLRSAAA